MDILDEADKIVIEGKREVYWVEAWLVFSRR